MEWRAMVIDVNSNNSHHNSGTGVPTLNTSTDPTMSTPFTPGFSPKYFRRHSTDGEERHALVGYPRIDSKREAEGLLGVLLPYYIQTAWWNSTFMSSKQAGGCERAREKEKVLREVHMIQIPGVCARQGLFGVWDC